MGRKNHVGRSQQPQCRGRRLRIEDVQAGSADPMSRERLRESLLVNDSASGSVNNEGRGLHKGQPISIDQIAGRRAERSVHGDVVAYAKQLIKLDPPCLKSRDVERCDERVGENNRHIEGSRSTGDLLANVSEADDADCLVVEFCDQALQPGEVSAPTLLLVGGADTPVILLNRQAMSRLDCGAQMVIVPGAGHLFEEPGAMDEVVRQATAWFRRFLRSTRKEDGPLFADRRDAGRKLAKALSRFRGQNAIVLALPRGGVPVGFEVAKSLRAQLDLLLVRKIGVPGHSELALGAVVDGSHPETVVNEDVMALVRPPAGYLEKVAEAQLIEIERRRKLYRGGHKPLSLAGRSVIVVDDGIATGATIKAGLKAAGRQHPRRLILAVPVAPAAALRELAAETDEVVVLQRRSPLPLLACTTPTSDKPLTKRLLISLLARPLPTREPSLK